MSEVQDRIAQFVLDELLLGDTARMPAADESLIETGTVDSTGVLELIEFLESEFGIHVADTETVPENLDGIERLAAFVGRKAAS